MHTSRLAVTALLLASSFAIGVADPGLSQSPEPLAEGGTSPTASPGPVVAPDCTPATPDQGEPIRVDYPVDCSAVLPGRVTVLGQAPSWAWVLGATEQTEELVQADSHGAWRMELPVEEAGLKVFSFGLPFYQGDSVAPESVLRVLVDPTLDETPPLPTIALPTIAQGCAPRDLSSSLFSITSPADCEIAGTYQVLVRGTASPGARIVRDISMAPDDSVTTLADGTWQLSVIISEGENEIKLRYGDVSTSALALRIYGASGVDDLFADDLASDLDGYDSRPSTRSGPSARWKRNVCAAVWRLDDASEHLSAAARAGLQGRRARLVSQADAAIRDSKATLRDVKRAGVWRPGSKLLKELRIGAKSYARAARLLKKGARNSDPKLIKRATIEVDWAGISFTLIVDELEELQASGVSC